MIREEMFTVFFPQEINLYVYKGNKPEVVKTTEFVFLKLKTVCHPSTRSPEIYKMPFRHTIGCKSNPRLLLALESLQDSEISQQQWIVHKPHTLPKHFCHVILGGTNLILICEGVSMVMVG